MCIGNPTMQYLEHIVMQFVSNLHGTRIRMSLPSHLHALPVPTIRWRNIFGFGLLRTHLASGYCSSTHAMMIRIIFGWLDSVSPQKRSVLQAQRFTDTYRYAYGCSAKTKMLPCFVLRDTFSPSSASRVDYVPSAEWGLWCKWSLQSDPCSVFAGQQATPYEKSCMGSWAHFAKRPNKIYLYNIPL